jgi:integrase
LDVGDVFYVLGDACPVAERGFMFTGTRTAMIAPPDLNGGGHEGSEARYCRAADVADLVAQLSQTRKRETVRKSLLALAMILDHAGVGSPNAARDKITVKLPREERHEIAPPLAEHVEAIHDLLPSRYRLPLLVLDATGMRLGELEGLCWGDVDEQRGRWRVSQAVSKTSRARWVNVPPVLFEAVTALVARDDRVPGRPVFQGFGGDRFRTAITRACTAAGVPAFSPHDLRHRRISLLHLGGVPWARIGEHVGQRNLAVTANTYSHVLTDERELDYPALLVARNVHAKQRAD